MKYIWIVLVSLIVLLNRGYADLTLTIPQDTFYIGRNISVGQPIIIPIYVDSIPAVDSICGYQIKFTIDTDRLQPGYIPSVNAGEGFTQSEQFTTSRVGNEVRIFMTIANANTFLVGSGLLLEISFTVVNDTAGFTPINFDTMYFNSPTAKTAAYECLAEGSPEPTTVSFACINGGITFIPTADLMIPSGIDTVTGDSVLTDTIVLNNVRGDRVKSISFYVAAGEQKDLAVAASVLNGTLAGELNSTANQTGGNYYVYGERDSISDTTADSTNLIILKLLIHGKSSFQSTLFLDSLKIVGFLEPFSIDSDTGLYTIVFKTTGLKEENSSVDNQQFYVFPNPARNEITLSAPELERYHIDLFDEVGKNVYHSNMGSSLDNSLDLKKMNLSNGVYTIRIQSGNDLFTQRIILIQ